MNGTRTNDEDEDSNPPTDQRRRLALDAWALDAWRWVR